MFSIQEQKENLLSIVASLHERHERSAAVSPDYFEPGMMEYLEQSEGSYNQISGEILIRFEAKGTRYEGRTEQLERVNLGDGLRLIRERNNVYNPNNFTIVTMKGKNVGNVPAQLCNAMAPLYDSGELIFLEASVSYLEPISRRSRYAKQAILFVELKASLLHP